MARHDLESLASRLTELGRDVRRDRPRAVAAPSWPIEYRALASGYFLPEFDWFGVVYADLTLRESPGSEIPVRGTMTP